MVREDMNCSTPVICINIVDYSHSMFLQSTFFKDGAYICYCTFVLRISRYSGFLWVVPTNTGIFLRSLNLCWEGRT